MYQELLDVSGQKGSVFVPSTTTAKSRRDDVGTAVKKENIEVAFSRNVQMMTDLVQQVCDSSYKQFEATLKCGGYAKLESAITIWPPPLVRIFSAVLICFISLLIS